MSRKKMVNKEIVIFWITESVKFAALEYGIHEFQNIKMDYKIDILDKLKIYLKTKNILGQYQEKVNNPQISLKIISKPKIILAKTRKTLTIPKEACLR